MSFQKLEAVTVLPLKAVTKPSTTSSYQQATVKTSEHYAQTTKLWKKEIYQEVHAKLGKRPPVVVVNKFNPRNYLRQLRPKVTVIPKINNYNQLPEAPNLVVKPTVRAPKVTVKPTFQNWVNVRTR